MPPTLMKQKRMVGKSNYLKPESGNLQSESKSRLMGDFLRKIFLWLRRVYLIWHRIKFNAQFGFAISESCSARVPNTF
jgi:hypothetical protein